MEDKLREITELTEAARELALRSAEQNKDWSLAIQLIMTRISTVSQSTLGNE